MKPPQPRLAILLLGSRSHRSGLVVMLGCCTFLLYLHGLALQDGEVVGRTWSRLAHMLAIMRLAWQEAAGHRWTSSVIFKAHGTETEQVLDPSCSFDT